MDLHDKIIRGMCGETNNDVSYSVNADNSKYVDSLKYRNEIEVMSRLRNYKVSDLYNESTNADVSNKINELYPSQDLYVYNDNPIVNDIMSNPISWDTYFMNMALLASLRSKDENTKVGSVLVLNNKVVGMGYNGLPSHLDESKFPTSRDASLQYNATKYAYVVHAELNSILNTTVYDLNGSKIYCTLFPCNECAKVIIQKGISEVIYLSDKYHDEPHYVASRKLLDEAGINYRQYTGKLLVNM